VSVSHVNNCFIENLEVAMQRRPLESLGAIVRERRAEGKLRETAREIGIGPATLMRVEAGRIPDLETFGKLCTWLDIDPKEFKGIGRDDRAQERGRPNYDEKMVELSAHFRADRTPEADTVKALAQMVFLALSTQPRRPDLDE
jgi:transcriptional regulator with XRE-family HTH domain